MHIYFSGIGGAGIAPLALVAKQAGYTVSGSDKTHSGYIDYLKNHGITNILINQTYEQIKIVNESNPIDWLVYSSAIVYEDPNSEELKFAKDNGIKISKRDEFINEILDSKKLKMIAIAGTHGKTTTTAMLVYLFKKLNIPVSYILPAKTSFASLGEYSSESQYFIYEADEFDRNFLSYEPYISLISGVSWDHHEIYKTRNEYISAFVDFINQSKHTILWEDDFDYLAASESDNINILSASDKNIQKISLVGMYNRLDAYLAVKTLAKTTDNSLDKLINIVNSFPSLSRRMEEIVKNLYSDYAHTPEKIRGVMNVAAEMSEKTGQKIIVIYEPLTNRRQHFIKNEYGDVFNQAEKVYWLPSYLAREDKDQPILTPNQLISHLDNPSVAVAAERNNDLKKEILKHLNTGDMVIAIAGGGGGSLDDWVRAEFK